MAVTGKFLPCNNKGCKMPNLSRIKEMEAATKECSFWVINFKSEAFRFSAFWTSSMLAGLE